MNIRRYPDFQDTFDFIDEIVPIPECSGLMAMSGYKTPQALADEMVREARIWQKGRKPGKLLCLGYLTGI